MSWDSQRFDWYNSEDIAVPHQAQIAVYTNPAGDVVIRQDGSDYCQAEDPFIVIRPDNVRAVVDAMLALIEPELESASAAPATSTSTSAERQRRYRERQRNGGTVTPERHTVTPCRNGSVTPRDGGLFEHTAADD